MKGTQDYGCVPRNCAEAVRAIKTVIRYLESVGTKYDIILNASLMIANNLEQRVFELRTIQTYTVDMFNFFFNNDKDTSPFRFYLR